MPRIRLLTGGDLEFDNDLTPGALGRMPRALLVLLLLHAGDAIPRDKLADILWPDADQPTARHRLRMALQTLRRSLGPLRQNLESSGDRLRLDVPRSWIDVIQFEASCQRGAAGIEAAEKSLYRGPLLGGFPSVSPEFDAYLDDRRDALQSAALASVQDDLSGLSGFEDQRIFEERYRRALELDPCSERTFLLAMEYWARLGSRPEVLRYLEEARIALRRHLDADVSTDLSRAADRLSDEATAVSTGNTKTVPDVASREEVPATEAATVTVRPRRIRMIAAGLIVLFLVVAYLTPSLFMTPAAYKPIVRLVSESTGLSACKGSDISDVFEASLIKAVQGVTDATFFLGSAPEDSRAVDLILAKSLSCDSDAARASVSLTDAHTGTLIWIRRYTLENGAADALQIELQDGIRSAIRSAASTGTN